MAILLDAIETLKNPAAHDRDGAYKPHKFYRKGHRATDPVRDAQNWLNSDDVDYAFSFATICEHFHWSVSWMRSQAFRVVAEGQTERRAKPQRLTVRGQYRRPGGGRSKRA